MRDQNEEDLNNYKTKMIAEDITSANVPSAAMTDTVLENNSAATTKIPSLKAITDNNSINAAAPATTEEAIKALEGIGSPKNSLQDQDNQGEGQGQGTRRGNPRFEYTPPVVRNRTKHAMSHQDEDTDAEGTSLSFNKDTNSTYTAFPLDHDAIIALGVMRTTPTSTSTNTPANTSTTNIGSKGYVKQSTESPRSGLRRSGFKQQQEEEDAEGEQGNAIGSNGRTTTTITTTTVGIKTITTTTTTTTGSSSSTEGRNTPPPLL